MTDQVVNKSGQYFKSGYHCAESVLLAVSESKGIESDLIPRIATGFCSGLARTGGLCGAVSGAVMALNLIFGRLSNKDSVNPSYMAVNQLIGRFEERFGSTNCSELIGCRLDTREGQRCFAKDKLIEKCRELTQEATRMTMEIIDEISRLDRE